MKNIYLTEEQYINYVLLEYSKYGEINESKFDIRKLFQTLYRGCRNFSDYVRRTTYIVSAGIISATLVYTAITKFLPITEAEKQMLITQVENLENIRQPRERVINLNFRVSSNGIEHIKQYEKCYLKPYYATKAEKARGIKTIGWGHKIIPSDPEWLKRAPSITQEQADQLFSQDIHLYEKELAEAFKVLPKHLQDVALYPQGFIDACVSIIYNSGRKNLKESPFFKTLANCRLDKDGYLNHEDFIFTCSKIKDSCITQQGKIIQGLVNRRKAESLMAQQ